MALPPRPASQQQTGLFSEFRHLLDLARTTLPGPHPAGLPFVFGALGAAGLGFLAPGRAGRALRRVGFGSAAVCAAFFRNPSRVAPDDPKLVLAPADGRITLVDQAPPPAELGLGEAPLPRVSVFLSIFDVHVQHAPVAGKVLAAEYRAGEFGSAERLEASERNERLSLVIQAAATGQSVIAVQIAGLLARRIVCAARPGDELASGGVYGLIRFGSRVDVYLPAGTKPLVKVGQRAVAGETALAALS